MDKATAKIAKRLGKTINALRLHRNWTQEECAANLGIATAYLSRVERGVVNVTLRNLVRMAQGFNVDVSELLAP